MTPMKFIKRSVHVVLPLAICLICALACAGQTAAGTAPRDPQALAAVAKALSALDAGAAVQSVNMTGTVARTAGDTEQGTITLEATSRGQSRVEMDLPSGAYLRTRDDSGPAPAGQWSGPDGKARSITLDNAISDPVWFFPALGRIARLATAGEIGISYVGPATRDGESLIQLKLWRQPAGQTADVTSSIAALSAANLYLDAATLLPRFLDFNAYPDKTDTIKLPMEVRFSAYQRIQGINVPMHIEEMLRGTPLLDITIQNVVINGAVSPSAFSIQ